MQELQQQPLQCCPVLCNCDGLDHSEGSRRPLLLERRPPCYQQMSQSMELWYQLILVNGLDSL
jgi:hypothetical protein